MNQRQKKKQVKIQNKKLIEKYPFLLPRSCWSGKVVKGYDYTYTELDNIPKGWRKSFGILMCEELKEALIKADLLNTYRIYDIKEKYASLRWSGSGATQEVYDIIDKYEYLSRHICIVCGKFDVNLFDDGWVCPYCDKCFIEQKRYEHNRYKKILEKELEPFDAKKEMKFKLDYEPIENFLVFEIHSKEGISERKIDMTETINKLRK